MEKSAVNNEVSITKVKIKKENINDDIKEFAETAMNELLGWYGYENSREETRNPRNCRFYSGSNSSESESPKFTEGCGWCGKLVDENNGLVSSAATFCSELCFSQSRRASFKKNKVCDWCRHVRHTVSYVDFQDGVSQLQFCSDKCLNQYKMHIFCRETTAHLELHPHLHGEESTSGSLITPDLWLRNCKSPDRTPSPNIPTKLPEHPTQTSPLPLITVAHPSKLLSINQVNKRFRTKSQKRTRKKCPSTITSLANDFSKPICEDSPQDLRVRHTPTDFENDRTQAAVQNLSQNKDDDDENEKNQPDHPSLESNANSIPQQIAQVPLKKILENILPPPTVFVPYPVILPLPIPIPIPIPIPKIMKKEVELKDNCSQTELVRTEENETDSSQNEILDVVCIDAKESERTRSSKRPLRKRRKINEPKTTKVFVKTRKLISSSAN